jgi:hypothetical protein
VRRAHTRIGSGSQNFASGLGANVLERNVDWESMCTRLGKGGAITSMNDFSEQRLFDVSWRDMKVGRGPEGHFCLILPALTDVPCVCVSVSECVSV